MKPGEKVSVDLPPEDNWTMFDVQRDGLPEILLVNDGLRQFTSRDIFPWHLSIIIGAREIAANGMPDPDEAKLLTEIGRHLEDVLESAKTEFDAPNILYLARSTWNEQRELIYRVHDPEIANTVLQTEISSKKWERDWDFRMEEDTNWSLAAPILSMYPTN